MAQCCFSHSAPFDKVLGASNLAMLRYEWIWYKERGTGFLNANRAPLKKSENILVFYQKSPFYDPQFTYGKPYTRVHSRSVQALTMGNLNGRAQSPTMAAAIPEMCFLCLRCPAASIPHRSPWSFVSI